MTERKPFVFDRVQFYCCFDISIMGKLMLGLIKIIKIKLYSEDDYRISCIVCITIRWIIGGARLKIIAARRLYAEKRIKAIHQP